MPLIARVGIFAVGLTTFSVVMLCLPGAASLSSATTIMNANSLVTTLCVPSVQERQIRSVFQGVDTFAEHPDRLEHLVHAVEAAAKCFPSNGIAWTALALLELANKGDTPAFRIFFQRSVLVSPSEATAMKRRLTALLPIRDKYPNLLQANLDRYLQNAVHTDISDFLRPLPKDQRTFVIARMQVLSTAQIERWFQGHSDQAGVGR